MLAALHISELSHCVSSICIRPSLEDCLPNTNDKRACASLTCSDRFHFLSKQRPAGRMSPECHQQLRFPAACGLIYLRVPLHVHREIVGPSIQPSLNGIDIIGSTTSHFMYEGVYASSILCCGNVNIFWDYYSRLRISASFGFQNLCNVWHVNSCALLIFQALHDEMFFVCY